MIIDQQKIAQIKQKLHFERLHIKAYNYEIFDIEANEFLQIIQLYPNEYLHLANSFNERIQEMKKKELPQVPFLYRKKNESTEAYLERSYQAFYQA